MSLSSGDRLGPYEILASIGAGGMGEVFKARDTRLGRTVAVKVSAGKFTDRFEREARAVAALSHPNICTLHDVGPDYLVMEYIDGKPLKGPLPIETVVRYAREIASALDAAHRQGIVHRDLKPGNILATKGGIKLLDFGLAKMNTPEPVSDETVTKALTQEGTILGTLQYMAPEQLEGKEADSRSDIFSFGCVLYELITGRAAFDGESKASIIAAILDREPRPLTGVPPALARAIHRAMAKDPDERWQSARDVAGVLELVAMAPEAAPQKARTPKGMPAAFAAIAILAVAAAIWFAMRQPLETAWSGEHLGGPAAAMDPRVSPDGHTIAFQAMVDGQTQIGILKPETGNWTVLTHQKTLGQISELCWSPDGSKIYFDRQTDSPAGVYSVPVLGGEPRMVLESALTSHVLADGSLLVIRINAQREFQLHRFWPESGKLEPLPAVLDIAGNAAVARGTPDGKQVVFYGAAPGASGRGSAVYVLHLESKTLRRLAPSVMFQSGTTVALAAAHDGRSAIISVASGSLYRLLEVPIDGGGATKSLLTLTGLPWYLDVAADGTIYTDQISSDEMLVRFPPTGGTPERVTPAYRQKMPIYAVLRDGRPLVYTNSGTKSRFVIVEPDGGFSSLIESNERCGPPATLVSSRHVAVLTDKSPVEIAIVSIADGRIVSRLPLQQHQVSSMSASPDGKMLYYTAGGFAWSIPVAGGKTEQLTPADSVSADPNGRDLVVSLSENESTRLMRVPVAGGPPQSIGMKGDLRAVSSVTGNAVGPDGRVVVHAASASMWTYVAALVDPKSGMITRVPVNFDGELDKPTWTPDGKLIATGRTHSFTIWRFRPSRR